MKSCVTVRFKGYAMTRDDIVKWAAEAGIMPPDWGATENQWRSLHAFADLAAAYEREECAKVCDKLGDQYADANPAYCAFALRERGAP
jgi:hypothetical protein